MAIRVGRCVLAMLLLIAITADSGAVPPKRVLLLGQGPDGHPPTTHEYMAGLRALSACLKPVEGLDVGIERADEPWKEGPALLDRADGVVIFLCEGAKWSQADPQRAAALSKLAARQGGIVGLHWGIGCKSNEPIGAFLSLLGGCHGGDDRKYEVLETTLKVADPGSPIVRGIADFDVHDEFYYQLKFVRASTSTRPLLTTQIDGTVFPVAWSWERPDGGRSFGFSGLHFHENWRLPEYRRLAAQAVLWSLKLPIPENGLSVDIADRDLKLD